MYRKLLLAGTMLASMVAMQAKEVYLIKDGKLAEGVELLETTNENLVVEEGVEAPGGTGKYLEYTIKESQTAQYSGRMFYVADGINLDEVWMVDMTYYFQEGDSTSGDNLKREGMRLDLLGDTLTMPEDTFKFDYNQSSRRFAHLGYDIYFRNFFEYDEKEKVAVPNGHGLGKDYTASRYIFTKSGFVDAVGSKNMVKVVSLACGQEAPSVGRDTKYYIKELKFYSKDAKPFYNEKFHSATDAAAISASGKDIVKYTINNRNKEFDINDMGLNGLYQPNELYGSSYLYATLDANESEDEWMYSDEITVGCPRLWQSDGMQCKDGIFYDVETGYMLEVPDAEAYYNNSIYVRIPFTGAAKAGEKIKVKFLAGHHGCGNCAAYSKYDKDASKAPFAYRFEKGDLSSFDAVTEVKDFSSVDTLSINVVEVEEDIEVPTGDYNILTVIFNTLPEVRYVVGDMTVTGPRTVKVVESQKSLCGKTEMPFVFEASTGLDNVVALNELAIYPNPVYNVFTVAGDVKKMEIINLAGSVVMSVEANTANVANLPAGMYIVKAFTESGVATGRIIKK